VGEFVYITDDTYTKKQVLRMEHLILKVLAFDLSVPTILSFITNFTSSNSLPDTTMYLAMVSMNYLFLRPLIQAVLDLILNQYFSTSILLLYWDSSCSCLGKELAEQFEPPSQENMQFGLENFA
jgi:hypothetical protein